MIVYLLMKYHKLQNKFVVFLLSRVVYVTERLFLWEAKMRQNIVKRLGDYATEPQLSHFELVRFLQNSCA